MISLFFDLTEHQLYNEEKIVGKLLINELNDNIFKEISTNKSKKEQLTTLLKITPFKRLFYISFSKFTEIKFNNTETVQVECANLTKAGDFKHLPIMKINKRCILTVRLITE